MPLVGVQSQPSNFVFGLLTLAANETKPLTDAIFSRVASAPGACRGVTIKLRSGAAKLCDKSDATDGWTLTVGAPFSDDTASNLEGWYIQETAGGAATIEVICRAGGAS